MALPHPRGNPLRHPAAPPCPAPSPSPHIPPASRNLAETQEKRWSDISSAETIWFYGSELRGVHCGYRKVTPLKVGRKWVKLDVEGKFYRVRKEVWGKWPRKAEEKREND